MAGVHRLAKIFVVCSFVLYGLCSTAHAADKDQKSEKQNSQEVDGQHEASSPQESRKVARDLSKGWLTGTKAYNLAGTSDARFTEPSEGRIELESGSVFIEGLKTTTVVTPLAEYTIKPRSLVYLHVTKGAERALAMLENLSITTAKRSTELRFGEAALVTEHQPSHSELMGEEQLGIRQLRAHQISPDRHIAIAEYSLIQATERIPIVSEVIHSGHPHDKTLKAKILKAAAVLNMVTARHGYYSGSH